MHSALELTHRELGFSSEFDAEQSGSTRERLRQELARPHALMAGAHFSNRDFGRYGPLDQSASVDFSMPQYPAEFLTGC